MNIRETKSEIPKSEISSSKETNNDFNKATDKFKDLVSSIFDEKEITSTDSESIEKSESEVSGLEKLNTIPPETTLEANKTYIIDGEKVQTDDNGKIYFMDGKLLPNCEYQLNGYKYKTDKDGRPVKVTAAPLVLSEGTRDEKAQREVGGKDRKPNDHGGHLIANIFGGNGSLGNLVPMKQELNQGDYKKMENDLAKALKEGKQVSVSIDIIYDDNDTQRPSIIKVTYTIDGEKFKKTFNN